MSETDDGDTQIGAGADDTVIVPDVHPTQVSPELAWSSEQETEEFERRPWQQTLRYAGIVVVGAAFVAMGIALVGLLIHQSRSAQLNTPTTTQTPTPPPVALPPLPTTVTVTAPPPVTVTAEAPPEPKLEGVDARFIAFLRNNDVGSVYVNVSNATAIANARLICSDMLHNSGFQNVADNLGLSDAQLAWFADTASANYCPQFGGNI